MSWLFESGAPRSYSGTAFSYWLFVLGLRGELKEKPAFFSLLKKVRNRYIRRIISLKYIVASLPA